MDLGRHTRVAAALAVFLFAVAQFCLLFPTPAGATALVGSYGLPYLQTSSFGPGSDQTAGHPNGQQFNLYLVQAATSGTTYTFTMTISRPAVLPSHTAMTPELQLEKNPALAPSSLSDPCRNSCSLNLTRSHGGWSLAEIVNGSYSQTVGPATVSQNKDQIVVNVNTTALTAVAQRVIGDPTTDVQGGFVVANADGSGQEHLSTPYALASLTGEEGHDRVLAPWQGRQYQSQSLINVSCVRNAPLSFSYDPATYRETVRFQRPIGPGVTVEGGGPNAVETLGGWHAVVAQTVQESSGRILAASSGLNTTDLFAIREPVNPGAATVAGKAMTITLVNSQGAPLIQAGGGVTAEVAYNQGSSACVYLFPIVALASLPSATSQPSSSVTSETAASFLVGSGFGYGIGAVVLGLAATVAVIYTRSKGTDDGRDGTGNVPNDEEEGFVGTQSREPESAR